MTDFRKYMHVERLYNPEVDGILKGTVYVFPKLDGANASLFMNVEGDVQIGSRNQPTTRGYDTLKMYSYLDTHDDFKRVIKDHPTYIIYGEWLSPHTITTYYPSAYYNYYVFDVYDIVADKYLPYEEYSKMLDDYGIHNYLKPLAILENPDYDEVEKYTESNVFLMTEGVGEGVVIKNYDYINRFGRIVWAKVVREGFKVKAHATNKGEIPDTVEMKIIKDSLPLEYVSKEYFKLTVDEGVEWNDKLTPDFIRRVYSEWWKDCSFEILTGIKGPVVMKELSKCASRTIVKYLKDIRRNEAKKRLEEME